MTAASPTKVNHVVPEHVRLAAAAAAHRPGTWWQHLIEAPPPPAHVSGDRSDNGPSARKSALAGWRDAEPVVHDPETNEYYVTQLDDILAALRNPALTAYRQPFLVGGCPVELLPLSYEGAAHARYRRILQPFFLPRPLAALPLRDRAADLIDPVVDRRRCDFITEIARPFAVTVVMELLGLPLADLENSRACSRTTTATSARPERKPPISGTCPSL